MISACPLMNLTFDAQQGGHEKSFKTAARLLVIHVRRPPYRKRYWHSIAYIPEPRFPVRAGIISDLNQLYLTTVRYGTPYPINQSTNNYVGLH
jgi:hypothetical protein